jgi:hypothetical protein
MRIGLIGPAEGNVELLREAAEFLLGDCEVDEAVYLGVDDTVEEVVEGWAREVMAGPASEDAFLSQACDLAIRGEARAIDELLERDRELSRLSALRCLPPPPARAVEVFDDKVVLFVYDKSTLDEDDIANASLVVYGKGRQMALHRFGPRAFYTPGPLRSGCVALIEREPDGSLALAYFNPTTGEPTGREALLSRGSRFVVQS